MKLVPYLWPLGVAGHGKKDVPSSKVTTDGKCILAVLLHVPSAPSKAGRKDDPLANGVQVCVSIGSHSISNALVHVCTDLVLVFKDPTQAILLRDCPCIS